MPANRENVKSSYSRTAEKKKGLLGNPKAVETRGYVITLVSSKLHVVGA
jgi:hypothetical protein